MGEMKDGAKTSDRSLWERRTARHHRKQVDRPQTSVPMATFLLTNTMVGSIIVLPVTLKQAGFGLGIVLLVVFGFVADYTLKMLIHAGTLSGADSYPGIMKKAYGRGGYFIVSFLLAAFSFYVMVAMDVTIGDMGHELVILVLGDEAESQVYGERWFIIGVINLLILFPLSSLRNIGFLSQASVLAIILDYTFIVFMAIRLGTLDLEPTENAYNFASWDIVEAVGVLLCIYVAHHAAFLIYDSMINKTEKKWNKVSNVSITIVVITYITVGVLGFVTFTGNTQGDILENYCSDDVLMSVGRFFFLITISLTYPISAFVVRDIIVKTTTQVSQLPLYAHVLLTFFLVAAAYGVSLLASCLTVVVEIAGFLAAAPLALILPPLAVIRLEKRPVCSPENVPLILTAMAGISLSIIGSIIVLFHIIDGKGCPQPEVPEFCTAANLTLLSTLGP